MSNKYLIYILASFLVLISSLAGIIYFISEEQRVTFTSGVPDTKSQLLNPKLLSCYLPKWKLTGCDWRASFVTSRSIAGTRRAAPEAGTARGRYYLHSVARVSRTLAKG